MDANKIELINSIVMCFLATNLVMKSYFAIILHHMLVELGIPAEKADFLTLWMNKATFVPIP